MHLTWSSTAVVVKFQKGSRNYKVHTSNRDIKLDNTANFKAANSPYEGLD